MTPPGPGFLRSAARLRQFRRDPLSGFRNGWHTYGDLYRARFGGRDIWVCSHPDLMHEVLVSGRHNWLRMDVGVGAEPLGLALALGDGLITTDGADWQWRRRIVNPAFHRQQVDQMASTMVQAGHQMLDRLDRLAARSEVVDLLVEMKLVTQDIIGRTMFSADIAQDADRIGSAVDEALRYVARREGAVVRIPRSWPTPAARRFRRAMRELDAVVYRTIRQRRQTGPGPGDLLDLLIGAQDEETGRSLNDEQIRNEVATVYGAGHETTANALTWAWHELVSHPEVLERLQKEADRQPDSPIAAELDSMRFTRMVFEETLRFRPPVPINARVAQLPAELGGHDVRAGAMAVLVVNNVHRHPDFWEQPERFHPGHFTPEAKAKRHRHAWVPFGAGPHLCIGNHFAMVEGCLLLAMMAKRFTFRALGPTPAKPAVAITMKPRGGYPVRVIAR